MINCPDGNPKTVQGEKKIDLSLVPPSAIIAEARVMALGARKYGPYSWRDKTASSRVYTAAALRHILTWQDGEETDPESGESHLAHARACLGIVIDAKSIGKLNDNRPTAGAAGRLLLPVRTTAEKVDALIREKIAKDGPLTAEQERYARQAATSFFNQVEGPEAVPPHTAVPVEKGCAMPDGMSATHYCVVEPAMVRSGYSAECSACRKATGGTG